MSWLSSFLHPEKGYEKGQEQLDKYYQQGQSFLQPYNQFGTNQYNTLMEFVNALKNPQKLQDQWAKSYTESESAKNAERMAQEHGLNAASSLGLMGSSSALDAIQKGTTQIGLDDRQKYLDDMMQKYMAAAGISGNIFNTGANTAGTMSNNAMNMGTNSANLAYGKENAPGSSLWNLLGLGGSLGAGALAGGR